MSKMSEEQALEREIQDYVDEDTEINWLSRLECNAYDKPNGKSLHFLPHKHRSSVVRLLRIRRSAHYRL